MWMRIVIYSHLVVVVLFAIFSFVDSGGSTRFERFEWYYKALEIPLFNVALGVTIYLSMLCLFVCPTTILIAAVRSKASGRARFQSVVAECLIVVGQIVALIPTIQ